MIRWLTKHEMPKADALLLHAVFANQGTVIDHLLERGAPVSTLTFRVCKLRCEADNQKKITVATLPEANPMSVKVLGTIDNALDYNQEVSVEWKVVARPVQPRSVADFPYAPIFKSLIDENRLVFFAPVIADMAKKGHWRAVQVIIEAQAHAKARFVFYPPCFHLEGVDEDYGIRTHDIFDFLGCVVPATKRDDLLVWFLKRGFISTKALSLGNLFERKNWPVIKVKQSDIIFDFCFYNFIGR